MARSPREACLVWHTETSEIPQVLFLLFVTWTRFFEKKIKLIVFSNSMPTDGALPTQGPTSQTYILCCQRDYITFNGRIPCEILLTGHNERKQLENIPY